MADAKKEVIQIVLPEGRLINGSLFEKDAYVDPNTQKPGTPQYKVEMAYEPDDFIEAEDAIVDAAVKHFGAQAEEWYGDGVTGKLVSPIIDGDELAKKREENGKTGDAYRGKLIIRSNTQFNRFGDNADGGINVYDSQVKVIEPVDRSQIYNGCYGIVAVTVGFYKKSESGKDAIKLYLSAFQKTRDGEHLSGSSDYSKVFKPVEQTATGRRSRG